MGLGTGDAKALAALTESDKEFEEKVRKSWQLMHSLVSTLHENIIKANANLTGKPFFFAICNFNKNKVFHNSLFVLFRLKLFDK